MNNTFSGNFVSQFFTGTAAARHAWLLAGVWSLLAIGVLVLAGSKLGRRPGATSNEQLAPALT